MFGCQLSGETHQINNISSGRRDADEGEMREIKGCRSEGETVLTPGEEETEREVRGE